MKNRSPLPATAAPQMKPSPVRDDVLQRQSAYGGNPGLTGKCAECHKERLSLHRRAANQTEPSIVPTIVHKVLCSLCRLLDPATRAFMESQFGHDFSQVGGIPTSRWPSRLGWQVQRGTPL